MCLTLAAMLSKEQGLTALAILLALDVAFTLKSSLAHSLHVVDGEKIIRLAPSWGMLQLLGLVAVEGTGTSSSSLRTTRLLSALRRRVALLAVCGALFVMFRISMLHGQQPIFNPIEIPASFHPDMLTRILTLNYLVVFNACLLFYPATLSMDWSHGSIPLVTSPSDWRVATVSLLYTVLVLWIGIACLPFVERWSSRWYATTERKYSMPDTMMR